MPAQRPLVLSNTVILVNGAMCGIAKHGKARPANQHSVYKRLPLAREAGESDMDKGPTSICPVPWVNYLSSMISLIAATLGPAPRWV